MPRRDAERREEERARLFDLVSSLYASGFSEGAEAVASRYGLESHLPAAARSMGGKVSVRIDLVDKAVDSYIEAIERKGSELLGRVELSENQRVAELTSYARDLAADKGQLISEMEWAKARLDGAGSIVDESGEKFEWRFPHFETASEDHEECAICEAIRERSPYSTEQAEAEGYPDLPHPNCDHGWVLVPKAELSRTEEFPQENQRTRT